MKHPYFSFFAFLVALPPLVTACSGNAAPGAATLPQLSGPQHIGASSKRPIATKTKSYIYVADGLSSAIEIYPAFAKDPNPVGTITQGIHYPYGIAIDKTGTLYVPNAGSGTLTEYPAGSTSPSVTLTQGLPAPGFAAIDPSGNLWVSNAENPGNVVEFPPGSTAPSTTLTSGIVNPAGIAFDAKGHLFVANVGNTSSKANVAVFPPGASSPSTTFGAGTLVHPQGVTVDRKGYVYVTDFYLGEGLVFAPKTYKLVRTIQGYNCCPFAFAMTIAVNNRLYIALGPATSGQGVDEFAKLGRVELPNIIQNGLSSSLGVAADPTIEP